MKKKKAQKGFGYIEIILLLAALFFLYYVMSNSYFTKKTIDTESKKLLSEQGIKSTNYSTLLGTVKKKLAEVSEQKEEMPVE